LASPTRATRRSVVWATAAHALNAIPTVVAAKTGVRTLADIDHFHGGRALIDYWNREG
jgi:hypothetical protein